MVHCDPKGIGVDAFFPRSHVINSTEQLYAFQRDYLFTEAESYLKKFLKSYAKQANKELQAISGENEAQMLNYNPDSAKINKEKLLICCKIVGTRLKDLHQKLEKKKGITADRATMGKIKTEERSFILRGPKAITAAYLKYVHKEEWYEKALRKYPQFKKDKRI